MDLIAKTRKDYNKIARHFSATRHSLWPELTQFKPFIKDGQRILDWGSGNGRLLRLMAGKDISYYGVDISRALITIARREYRAEAANGRAVFYCAARQDKIFPAEFFDLVFMVASFHHLPTAAARRQVLKARYREMKPGARLIITVWNLGSLSAQAKQKKDYQKIGAADWLVPWKNQAGAIIARRYYHHFKKSELKALLTGAGFRVAPWPRYNSGVWPNKKGGQNLVAVAQK